MDQASALREAASFRSEMGFDSPSGSPLVARRSGPEELPPAAAAAAVPEPVSPVASSSFERRGQTRPTVAARGGLSASFASESPSNSPPTASAADKSPRDRSSVPRLFRFGRSSGSEEESAASGGSGRKSPRASLSNIFHRGEEGAPDASVERPKSPRSSVPNLFRRSSAMPEDTDAASPPLLAPAPVPVPVAAVSPRVLPSKKSLPSASMDNVATVAVAPKSPRTLLPGRGGSHIGHPAAGAAGKLDLRARMSDRRRSRSMHNITQHEDEARDELSGPGLFGMPLEELAAREADTPEVTAVPHVMELLLRRMEGAGGFRAEGIFRLSVGSVVKEMAMARLHRFEYALPPAGDYDDPHLYCVLLKEWLKRLPVPLIGDYAGCLELAACPPERDAAIVARLWAGMTPLAQAVLRRLMRFVRAAVVHEKITRMSATNLCIVFAPGILRPHAQQSALEMLRDQPATQAALLKVYQWVLQQDDDDAKKLV